MDGAARAGYLNGAARPGVLSMSRLTAALLALLLSPPLLAGPPLDSMDALSFRVPTGKGKAELVEGKVGKAVRFHYDKDARSAFFIGKVRGSAEWDRAA